MNKEKKLGMGLGALLSKSNNNNLRKSTKINQNLKTINKNQQQINQNLQKTVKIYKINNTNKTLKPFNKR